MWLTAIHDLHIVVFLGFLVIVVQLYSFLCNIDVIFDAIEPLTGFHLDSLDLKVFVNTAVGNGLPQRNCAPHRFPAHHQ